MGKVTQDVRGVHFLFYWNIMAAAASLSVKNSFVRDEVSDIPQRLKEIPHTELITCHPSMVQIKVRKTAHKDVVLALQFPPEYPRAALIVELKSKTIPEKFLNGLVSVCDQETKRLLGKRQVMELVTFVCNFVSTNPFIVCSDELSYIKKELFREGDDLKVKQKAGALSYRACQGRYFIAFVLTVPDKYPAEHVRFEIKEANLPSDIMQVCRGHVAELARQCVEPPLRRKPTDPPFEPRPSLRVLADYIVKDTVRTYPLEECPLCKKPALPDDPRDVITEESDPNFIYRVYCGHCYHQHCLDVYVKMPPFAGKKCPKCNQRIFHDKFNVQPKLAEDRWAHQEARKREIAEVADFLGI